MTTLSPELEITINQLLSEGDDFSAALHATLADVGTEFGIYEVMSQCGPVTADCLATQAGIPSNYAKLWLEVQAAGNCVKHQKSTGLYSLWSSRLPKR